MCNLVVLFILRRHFANPLFRLLRYCMVQASRSPLECKTQILITNALFLSSVQISVSGPSATITVAASASAATAGGAAVTGYGCPGVSSAGAGAASSTENPLLRNGVAGRVEITMTGVGRWQDLYLQCCHISCSI